MSNAFSHHQMFPNLCFSHQSQAYETILLKIFCNAFLFLYLPNNRPICNITGLFAEIACHEV